MRRRVAFATALAVVVSLTVAVVASAHPERTTVFPMPHPGLVPKYRTSGPAVVVCKSDSRARLKKSYRGRPATLKKRLRLLRKCRYRHIQEAINASKSGYRVMIMPGVYVEEPSRRVPFGRYQQEPCASDWVETEGFTNTLPPPAGPSSVDPPVRPDRNHTIKCPNSMNLIAVVGDTRLDPDPAAPLLPQCIQLCDLQIEGMGRRPRDVRIVGDRLKTDVLRIDRADGIYLRNFMIEQASFNNIDIVETDGFRVSRVVARWAENYGVLAFTSIHGVFEHIEAYGNGDSGVYPGSNAKGCTIDLNAYGLCDVGATPENPLAGCGPTTTELRFINSHDNVLGYSGTAGNSTYIHDSEFHHNSAGLTTDSFASGHPGMPQECFRWERNRIHSNNNNFFTAELQDDCRAKPFEERKRDVVCPQFQVAVGTGVLIGGGNRNLLEDNWIYDNWRWGVSLIYVPAAIRGDTDLSHQFDTSNWNVFTGNHMGMQPDGTADPNGTDFWWDEGGTGNCWKDNASKSGDSRTGDPTNLPTCPGSSSMSLVSPAKAASNLPCTAWDPNRNPRPIACTWFDVPPEPKP